MRLTDEQVIQDNKRFANWNANALAELKYCGWNIPHRKSITNDDIHFYAWLCRSAVVMLKEQEAAECHRIVLEHCAKDTKDVVDEVIENLCRPSDDEPGVCCCAMKYQR